MKMDVISNLAIIFPTWIAFSIIFFVIYGVFFVQWKMYRASRLLTAFPNFPTRPIIGSLHLISGNMRTRVQKLFHLLKIVEKPTIFWLSYYPIICLTKSVHILQTINKNQDKDTLGFFENVVGDGIIFAKGEKWRYIRRILNQAFTVPMLKQYLHVFNEQSIILVKRLEENANTGTVFDLGPYMVNMSFDTIIENTLGYKMETQQKGGNEYFKAISKVLALESKRMSNPILFFDFFNTIYMHVQGYGKLYEKIQQLPKKILEEKIREYKLQKENLEIFEEKPTKTLADLLLKVHDEQPEFDERRMRIEISNMIYTGTDTSSTTLSFMCLMLAMHPEVQDKVYQEIQEVFKDGFTQVNMEDCGKLKYTDQCIKETLRMFPLVPLTFRKCSEPTKLDDEQVIPANTVVGFMYHAVHHDPSIYPDPEKYDPDRFSPENHSRNANNFMGFGVGHRSCIGMKYAMLSMKTELVYLLRKYKFTTDTQMPDIRLTLDMVLRSENGYLVKIWTRQSNRQC